MMDFYADWLSQISNNGNDDTFIHAFLAKEPESTSFLFESYDQDRFLTMLKLFQLLSIERLFTAIIEQGHTDCYTTLDISQFSDLGKAIETVPEILEFYPQGISYSDLGEKLMGDREYEACRKYGENHARTASVMSLARLSDKQPRLVFPTTLGHFLVDYQIQEKNSLLRALLLRNPFLQNMVSVTITGSKTYGDLVEGLSDSTARRRRQSIKKLMSFIFSGTEMESLLENIDWTV